MPTVMMMMILEMRSRDMFLQCPCTALTSQAKGRGGSGDLQWPLSKNLLLRWGSSQPLLPLADDLSLLLYGPLLERVPPQNVSSLAFFPFHHCIDSFLKTATTPQAPTSPHLCRMFTAKHLCLFLDSWRISLFETLCLKLGAHWESTSAAYIG